MKHSDLHKLVEELINYIDDHIKEKLTLDMLAENFYLSKFYLLRIFKNLTSLTLMEYVRARKLAFSLNELLHTNMSILDIALAYGFEQEQNYIRSFKNSYGITPSKFRKGTSPVQIVNKIHLASCISLQCGILFHPRYEVKPAFHVIGIRDTIAEDENYTKNLANNRGVDFFFNYRHKIKYALYPNTYIGLTQFINQDSYLTYYMPSLEVSKLDDIPEGMHHATVPASKYAVFRYIGNHSVDKISTFTMQELYDYIYLIWMPKLNYSAGDNGGFHFEEINTEVASESYCECCLYFPIQDNISPI